VVLDAVGQHVREDRGRDHEIERLILVGELEVRCGHRTFGIVGGSDHVDEAEAKVRQNRLEVGAAPVEQGLRDVEALVAPRGAEPLGQSEGQPSAAAADLENVLVRIEAAEIDEGSERSLAALAKQVRIGERANPHAEMFRRDRQHVGQCVRPRSTRAHRADDRRAYASGARSGCARTIARLRRITGSRPTSTIASAAVEASARRSSEAKR
jgi:hypothetical protein